MANRVDEETLYLFLESRSRIKPFNPKWSYSPQDHITMRVSATSDLPMDMIWSVIVNSVWTDW